MPHVPIGCPAAMGDDGAIGEADNGEAEVFVAVADVQVGAGMALALGGELAVGVTADVPAGQGGDNLGAHGYLSPWPEGGWSFVPLEAVPLRSAAVEAGGAALQEGGDAFGAVVGGEDLCAE